MARPDDSGEAAAVAALIRRRDPLFALIREFNLRPGRYMHASWAEALFTPELWRRLRQSRRAEPSLSRLMLRNLGLAGSFPAAVFAEPRARLALLDPEALERLALHLGIAAEGAALRRVIEGERVRRLRVALGAEACAFAVQRAPLLAPQADEAETADDIDEDSLPALAERLRSAGRAVLARALGGLPPEVLDRFRLKLPRRPDLDFILSNRSAGAAAFSVRVLRETEPRWASLFAARTA